MGIYSAVKSFVVEKFWLPATGKAADYNIFNTSAYAIGFAVAAAYIGFPLLKKLDVELNREFFLSITPFILLGGALRVLEDRAIVDSFLLVTPFIYLWIFLFTAVLLASTRYLFEDDYYRYFGGIGALGFIAILSLYQVSNWSAIPLTFGVFILVAGAGYLALKQLKPELAKYSFTIPVAAHYWDASTTVTVLSYGGSEKHVLAQFFVDLFGPAGMFVMKTLVIVPAVYYIREDIEGERKQYYLFLIALLGLALGTRNFLSLITG